MQAAQFSHCGARLEVGCKGGFVYVFDIIKESKKRENFENCCLPRSLRKITPQW